MVVKDHMYDSRIVDIKFHSSLNAGRGGGGQHVISSDRHIIKVCSFFCSAVQCTRLLRRALWAAEAAARVPPPTDATAAGLLRPAAPNLPLLNLPLPASPLPYVWQVWDGDSGEGYTNIEPEGEADINDVCVWPRSGLVMVGCDSGALFRRFRSRSFRGEGGASEGSRCRAFVAFADLHSAAGERSATDP